MRPGIISVRLPKAFCLVTGVDSQGAMGRAFCPLSSTRQSNFRHCHPLSQESTNNTNQPSSAGHHACFETAFTQPKLRLTAVFCSPCTPKNKDAEPDSLSVQYKVFFSLLFITLVNQNLQMLRWVGVTSTPSGSHVVVVSGCCKICGVSQRGLQLALSLLQGLGVACLLRNTATNRTISSCWSVLHVALGWDQKTPKHFHLIALL